MLLMFHVSLMSAAMLLTAHHMLLMSAITLPVIRCCSYLLHITHCLVHIVYASGIAHVCGNVAHSSLNLQAVEIGGITLVLF